MKKRRSENAQISKVDYDADGGTNAADAAAGIWEKASEDTVRNRRIFRTTRPPESATTTTDGPNAFANVKLSAGTATATPGFGGFRFGEMSNHKTSAPVKTSAPAPAFGGFTFGAGSKSGPAPAPAAPPAQTAAATTTTTTTSDAKTTSVSTAAPAPVVVSSEDIEGEIKFWQGQHEDLMVSVIDATPKPCPYQEVLDLSYMLQPARTISAGIGSKINLKQVASTAITPSHSNSSTTVAYGAAVAAEPAPSPASATAAPIPAFGAAPPPAANTAPAPAAKSPPGTTPGFSFGTFGTTNTTTAAAASTTTNTNATPPKTLTGIPSPPSTGGSGSQSTPAPEADGFTEASDPDWDNVATYNAVQLFCYNNGGWHTLTRKANLRIQQSKTNSEQHRMVARDELIGKVHLNMLLSSVPSAMLKESTQKKKKDNTTVVWGNIIFKGNDQERGPTEFLIKAVVDTSKSLRAKMLALGVKPGK